MAKQKCTKCKEKFDIVLCQCCQTKLFVDNGLLMYVSSYSSRAPRLAIKSAVLNFYSSDAVASARQALEDSVKDIISDHPALGVKRTDSVKRTACDAMLDDILDLLGALDKVEGSVLPKFVCSDASGLPPAGPEDGGSLMVVLEAVAAQQRQMKQMQESMNEMRIDLMRLQSKETATNDDTASIVIVEPPAGDKESADAKKESPVAPKNQHTKKEAAPVPSTSSSQSGGTRLYSGR